MKAISSRLDYFQRPSRNFSRFTLAILLLLCLRTFSAEPKLNEVTLEWGNRRLQPAEIFSPWLPEYQAGSNAFVLSNATVLAFDAASRLLRWTASISGTQELRWFGAGDDIAYLQLVSKNVQDDRSEIEPKLKRLSLTTGKWLSDLRISGSKKEEYVICVLARKDLAVVLTSTRGGEWSDILESYRVSGFIEPRGQQTWTQSFPALAELDPPSAVLLSSAKRPNEAIPRIRHLSWLGDNLLVCAGPRQSLICLEGANGKIRWSVERIWEFERGFIGPSVWSHYISRFASFESRMGENNIDAAARKRFDERWQCKIIGGPIVVHRSPSEWQPDGANCIFIGVAKASKEGESAHWGPYLSDTRLYELNASGEPLSVVTLPRSIDGSRCFAVQDAVIWNCQNNSVAKLQSSDQQALRRDMGPGGPDHLTKLSWYREFDTVEPRAWLVVDKPGDPVSFSKSRLFRVLSGGYVKRASDQTFHLPLSMIDYEDGRAQQMVLHVPLTGPVPLPATNLIRSGDSYRTWGFYFLGITDLRATGNKLAITLGMEKWSGVVTFNLPETTI